MDMNILETMAFLISRKGTVFFFKPTCEDKLKADLLARWDDEDFFDDEDETVFYPGSFKDW